MRIEATPEKGWLLTGPTRTGKSFSVECLCGEIELRLAKRGKANTMKFFNIDSFLVNKYGIKDILEQVRENAPAVIFIDEIDLLGLNRIGNNQLLSEFLTSMQSSMNADPSKIVIVIAATNNPQNIDKALRQNGRFGKEIRFEYPSRKYRMEFLKRELAAMAVDLSQFSIENLADRTNQKSFEDLKAIIRHAMTRAWFNGESLTQELLENSIDTEIHHIIPFNQKDLPENELLIIATHFAGRALATTLLETHDQLDKVTILARMADLKDEMIWDTLAKKDEKDHQQKIEYGYLATKQPHDSINIKTELTIINEAITLIAGFAAEELLLNSRGFTCHPQNHDRAFKIITDLVFGGLNAETLPKEINQQLRLQAYNILKKCHEDAIILLKDHKDALIALTDELLEKKIMTDKEVQAVINKVEGITEEQQSDTAKTQETTA
jgi:cell division protease FtsH